MKELDSFTVERLEELSTKENIPEVAALARIALAAKRAEPIYQYQSGVCNDQFDGIEWVWDDCDKGFYNQYDPARRRIVYTTPQLNSQAPLVSWINCSDRMPEDSGRYWCYVEEQNCLGKSHYQWNCSWNGDMWSDQALTGRVTHWMLLPKAPEKP
ncbi:TPA: DUF551 domain-containing protein [Yersinia enterocolitica]